MLGAASRKMQRECEMKISVGDKAPDFTLESHDGRTVRLSDFRDRRNVVVAFFPLAWTPV